MSSSGSRWKNAQPGRRARSGEAEQRVDVQVLLDQVAEQVEPVLAGGGEAHPRGTPAERGGEEGAAQFVSLKAAVPHGAEDVSRPGAAGELLRPVADGDAAVVDLVAGRRHAEGGARREPQCLAWSEFGADVEQPEPVDRGAGIRLDAVRVRDDLPQHLEAAADPEER